MKTLRIDKETWDWEMDPATGLLPSIDSETVDNQGNRIGEAEYVSQTVAQAERTFKGDVYLHKDENIPYLEEVLGFTPPNSYVEEQLRVQGLRVPLVTAIQVRDLNRTQGLVTGDIRVHSENGGPYDVSLD